MTEYEWEASRAPRAAGVERGVLYRSELARYAALEFPRENLGWVLKETPSRPAIASRRSTSQAVGSTAVGAGPE
jgi:hypothetical protein